MTNTCGSALDLAWDLYGVGSFPEYAWVLAENQIRGRGRMGRQWVSVSGNLFAALRLPDAVRNLDTLVSLALALPLVQTLADLGVPGLIKWPNDIMAGPCKVGGILVEEKQQTLIAGIGINLCAAPESSGTENFFSFRAGCLQAYGVNVTPYRLWDLFLTQILHHFPALVADPALVVKNVDACLAWKDQTVVVENTGKNDGPARILGIDPAGMLCIRTAEGITSISSGTIHPGMM
ncbi:MAG TPA: biotin--[acetyl-CoA-carboxylase] ligase [Desulfotignum sp.]|nr:biotin--[acetyl-CoA-carboxylase] ligase [Desulfotignum sp.]